MMRGRTLAIVVVVMLASARTSFAQLRSLDFSAADRPATRQWEIRALLANDSPWRATGGDDNGYTHGAQIGGALRLVSGLRVSVAYSTDLYTKAVFEDRARNEKYFSNENVLRVEVDTVGLGRMWYWRATAGWRRLGNDAHCTFLDASCQQILIHKWLSRFRKVSTPVDVEDGRGIVDTLLAGGAAGFRRSATRGRTEFRATAEVGGEYSPVAGASRIEARADAAAVVTLGGRWMVEAGGGLLATTHAAGIQWNPSVAAAFGDARWTVGLDCVFYAGTVQNYVLFNLPSVVTGRYDPIFRASLSVRFPG